MNKNMKRISLLFAVFVYSCFLAGIAQAAIIGKTVRFKALEEGTVYKVDLNGDKITEKLNIEKDGSFYYIYIDGEIALMTDNPCSYGNFTLYDINRFDKNREVIFRWYDDEDEEAERGGIDVYRYNYNKAHLLRIASSEYYAPDNTPITKAGYGRDCGLIKPTGYNTVICDSLINIKGWDKDIALPFKLTYIIKSKKLVLDKSVTHKGNNDWAYENYVALPKKLKVYKSAKDSVSNKVLYTIPKGADFRKIKFLKLKVNGKTTAIQVKYNGKKAGWVFFKTSSLLVEK